MNRTIKTLTDDPDRALEIVEEQRNRGLAAWIEDERGQGVDEEALKSGKPAQSKPSLYDREMGYPRHYRSSSRCNRNALSGRPMGRSLAHPFDRLEIADTTERGFMSRLLILGVLLYPAVTLYAQAQQPNTAKLKADAQKVVNIIRGDKAKTQAYCQINSLGGEIDMAAQARDEQKADVLTKKINDLEKQLGPEYLALFDALNSADQNSKDFQDILSMFDSLDQSCPR